jgi:hypothetical protein
LVEVVLFDVLDLLAGLAAGLVRVDVDVGFVDCRVLAGLCAGLALCVLLSRET